MAPQPVPRLGPEPFQVGADADPGQGHRDRVAEFVGEVGVDRPLLARVDVPDEQPEPAAGQLQHRERDVDPPLVGLHLAEQGQLGCHRRDAGLAQQVGGDRLHLRPPPLERRLITFQHRQLEGEDHEVEPLGVLVVVHERGRQRGQVLRGFRRRVRAELRPRAGGRPPLDPLAPGAHQEVVGVHSEHDPVQVLRHVGPQAAFGRRAVPVLRRGAGGEGLVQTGQQRQPGLEEPLRQGLLRRALDPGVGCGEELEVAAEVEHEEVGLVLPRAEEVGTQPRAASDHLPELGRRVDGLEEDQVAHLGHVDPGVEHVDGDGDVGLLLRGAEVVDQRLRVGDLVRDQPGVVPTEPGVVGVEPLLHELGVLLVAGEDDGLAEPVGSGHLVAAGHQHFEDLVGGVGVEQVAVEVVRRHRVGHHAVVVPVGGVPLVLLVLAQVAVGDPPGEELQRDGDRARRHEEALGDRLVEGVGVGRHPVLEFEEAVGVVVDLVLRGGGEPDQQGVEPLEDAAVLGVHRAVGLVDHHEVEEARPEHPAALLVPGVDQARHGRVGRHVDASVGHLLGRQVDGGGTGQVGLERADGLVDQGHAVGEEEDAFDPAGLHQLVDERDHRAGLARSGGHHEQGPAPPEFELLADPPDRAVLVVALNDRGVHSTARQRQPGRPPQHEQLEFVPGVVAGDLARRVARGVVPQPGLEPVREVDHRTPAGHRLEAVGVELRLLLPDRGLLRRALGLDHRQRETVGAPEDVVDPTGRRARPGDGDCACRSPRDGSRRPFDRLRDRSGRRPRHARHRELPDVGGVGLPARLAQVGVDETGAGAGLGVVVGVGRDGLRRLRGSNLGAQLLEFGLQCVVGRLRLGDGRVPGLVAGEQPLQFLGAERGLGTGGRRHEGAVEDGGHRGRVRCGREAEERPQGEVKQFLQHPQRGLGGDRTLPVDGVVAGAAHQRRLHHHLGAGDLLELRGADQGGEVVPVGGRQGAQVVDRPDELLQRPPGVEDRRARVGATVGLGPRAVTGELRPRRAGEVEVAGHGRPQPGAGAVRSIPNATDNRDGPTQIRRSIRAGKSMARERSVDNFFLRRTLWITLWRTENCRRRRLALRYGRRIHPAGDRRRAHRHHYRLARART